MLRRGDIGYWCSIANIASGFGEDIGNAIRKFRRKGLIQPIIFFPQNNPHCWKWGFLHQVSAKHSPVHESCFEVSELSISTISSALIASSTFIAGIARLFSSRKFNTSRSFSITLCTSIFPFVMPRDIDRLEIYCATSYSQSRSLTLEFSWLVYLCRTLMSKCPEIQ